jgi:hypothetical protein
VTVTASEEKEEEREVLPGPGPGPLRRQERARASSVTPAELPSPGVVTDSIRRSWQVAVLTGTFLAGMLNKPGSLVHAQPPTFAQAWDRHLECARHYDALLLRWPRYWWGAVHTAVIKPALNFAEVASASPAWLFVTAAVGTLIWYFS